MPKKNDPYQQLQEQIDQLIELITTILKDDGQLDFEQRLTMLDTASRGAMNVARTLKTVRDLQRDEADTFDLLREALKELENEWPELRQCKENLQNGGAVSAETEATNAG